MGPWLALSARIERTKLFKYSAHTGIVFLDTLPALDGLTRNESRVLQSVLAHAPFGDNIGSSSAPGILRDIGLDRCHAAAAIRSLPGAAILIEDEARKGTGRAFHPITPRPSSHGGA